LGQGERFSWALILCPAWRKTSRGTSKVKVMRLVGLVTEASDGTEVAEASRRGTAAIGVVIIDENEGKGEDEGENE
jgi:hypothetical protein